MKKYVIKKGGDFLSSDLTFTRKLNNAWLFDTRDSARDNKEKGESIYRVNLKPATFEKVR